MRPHRVILRCFHWLAARATKRKVNFVIAGAMKCGTTALDAYLRQHPDIGMADIKEVHFFDRDEYFRGRRPPYALYHSHFMHVRSRKLWGEATPRYMFLQSAPARLREYNPAMKMIVILRNPIERAYSHWNMGRTRFSDATPFGEAIRRPQEWGLVSEKEKWAGLTYVSRGFYATQLERVWETFPKSQTLVLRSEALRSNPLPVLNEICRFLEIPPFAQVENREAYAGQYAAPMNRPDWEFLKQTFEPDIKKLEQLLGWDCRNWLRAPAGLAEPAGAMSVCPD